ncbi:ABC transporter permease [Okibacterium endophyticum]
MNEIASHGRRGTWSALVWAAVVVEAVKTTASRVTGVTTVLLVVGVAVLGASMTLASAAGNEQVIAQLGAFGGITGWPLLLGISAQVISAGGVLAFGVVLSWMFGREFSEGTITALFALPVSRATISVAKLVVYVVWACVASAALAGAVWLVGLIIGLGPLDADAADGLLRQLVLSLLTALIAVPAAWSSTIWRGLLPGIAITVCVVVCAQVMVVLGTGAWFPFAAPALWAMDPSSVSSGQLALVSVVPLLFGLMTVLSWRRLELDR